MHQPPPPLPLDLGLPFAPLDFATPPLDLFLGTATFPMESMVDTGCWWLDSPFMSPPQTPTDTTEFAATAAAPVAPLVPPVRASQQQQQQQQQQQGQPVSKKRRKTCAPAAPAEGEGADLELPDSWIYWDPDSGWDASKLIEYIVKMSQPATSAPLICVKHKLAAVDALGQRLPSYEDLIAEALIQLNKENKEQFGCQPRFIFKWLAEKYKGLLPFNFKGSATQALKKAWRKGRFLRHERKYRINPSWKASSEPKSTYASFLDLQHAFP